MVSKTPLVRPYGRFVRWRTDDFLAAATRRNATLTTSYCPGGDLMTDSRDYHASRARTERDIAYRTTDGRASDAHMRLSALHLSRALILEEIDRRVGEARLTPPPSKAPLA
jgi:hypothetical protein